MESSVDALVSCPHAAECPGCPLIGLSYGEQLKHKGSLVDAAVHRFHELARAPVFLVASADPITGYRTRGKLVVSGNRVGLFAAGSHRVLDLPQCRVLAPELGAVAAQIRAILPLEVPLRAVDVRKVDTGVLVTLVTPEGADGPGVRDAARKVHEATTGVVGISVAHRDEGSSQVLGGIPVTLFGEARVQCRSGPGSPWHLAAPGSFVQAHAGQERRLVRAILDRVSTLRAARPVRVLELFSGVGVLSLELASRGHEVFSVESFSPSSTLCRAAAEAQRLPVTVETGNAAAVLHRLVTEGRRFDAVIVNPPRRGLSPALRADLGRLCPDLALYVSCEPLSLARDLADLARRGLSTTELLPHDMMPLSAEVETLAVLSRGAPPEPVVLLRAETFVAIDKPPHEPTTGQGDAEGSLLSRVRRLPGLSEAVPVSHLDPGTSGVCLFARRPADAPALAAQLASAVTECVALARGITREKGTVRRPLLEHGRSHDACTRYARRKVEGGHSLVVARPEKGRRHQIPRHLASLGHPVVGDERYGHAATNQFFAMRHLLDRPFLHVARVSWTSGEQRYDVSSPLPADLEIVLESLAATSQQGPGDPVPRRHGTRGHDDG